MSGETEDITARLIGLRDVLRNEIQAGQALASARMDGMDAARQQYLGSLTAERDALSARIQAVRDLAHTENVSLEQVLTVHLDKLQQQVDQRFIAMQAAAGDLRVMLDERYQTQTKALDAAFKAAEQAVTVALANAEKAVATAQRAADARFASVNEFRKALTDQTATFIPRAEYDAAHVALADRVSATTERMAALELRLTSRLDQGEGADRGSVSAREDSRNARGLQYNGLVAALMGISAVIAVVALLVTLLHK